MATKPDRRVQRKELSQVDQEFLNSVRERFSAHVTSGRHLNQTRLRRMLRIRDPYLGRRLFSVLDSDHDGKLFEDQFVRAVTETVLGSDQKKLRFVFDLHDADGDEFISADELDDMLKTSLSHSTLTITAAERARIVDALIRKVGRRNRIDFSDFRKLLSSSSTVRLAVLQSVSAWFGAKPGRRADVSHMRMSTILRYVFVVVPYYAWRVLLVLAYIGANVYFFQRAFFLYREAGANLYIQIARGGGACLNFNGMLILIPMMRTLLTWIRKTFLVAFVPVDQNIEIHKWVGRVMFFFALVHTAGHVLNYNTLTESISDSLFGTTPGLTGFITLAAFVLMWFFSMGFIRRTRLHSLFSATHLLYWVWFPAAIIHADSFLYWAALPILGFLIELALRRFIKRENTFVEAATTHSTGVTHLQLHRPSGFEFEAGEYLFLRIPRISRFGWHPFTISSAPEVETTVGVHVRTLGNWTNRLFKTMDGLPQVQRRLPALVHGPYGTPSARIFASKFAVLIGAGIGVTPFASILDSIAYHKERGLPMRLEKVYFYWLYRGQKSFEWFGDLLPSIEARAGSGLIDMNVYLTDARIDATTGLLKIGMDLLGKESGSDGLTGLKSHTNFGRPDWNQVFDGVSRKHKLNRVNVFYCGPYPLGRIVRSSARKAGFHFRMENF